MVELTGLKQQQELLSKGSLHKRKAVSFDMSEVDAMMKEMDLDNDDRVDLTQFLSGVRLFAHVLTEHGLAGLAETLPEEQLADPSVTKTIDALTARTQKMLAGIQAEIEATRKKEEEEEKAVPEATEAPEVVPESAEVPNVEEPKEKGHGQARFGILTEDSKTTDKDVKAKQ
jgi:hypothetical protein